MGSLAAQLTGDEKPPSRTRHAKSIPGKASVAAGVRLAHVGKSQRPVGGQRDSARKVPSIKQTQIMLIFWRKKNRFICAQHTRVCIFHPTRKGLPVVGVDGQVPLLPQDAGDGKGLRFALQRHRAARFGFEQSPEDIPGKVRRRC